MHKLMELIPAGLSAGVYTQTTDVEVEVNGLITYDREICKIRINTLHKINQELYDIKIDIE